MVSKFCLKLHFGHSTFKSYKTVLTYKMIPQSLKIKYVIYFPLVLPPKVFDLVHEHFGLFLNGTELLDVPSCLNF